MICLVAGLVAPTIHQSHRELVNIVSSSGGLATMQTDICQVASTCRLRLGPKVRRDPLSGTPGGFNKVDEQLSEACKKSLISRGRGRELETHHNSLTQYEMETHDHVGLTFRGWAVSLGVLGTACTHAQACQPSTQRAPHNETSTKGESRSAGWAHAETPND